MITGAPLTADYLCRTVILLSISVDEDSNFFYDLIIRILPIYVGFNMSCLIKELILPEDLDHYHLIQKENQEVGIKNKIIPLSKVNIFVGANNSGKNRFTRSIFTLEKSKFEFKPGDTYFPAIKKYD